MINSNLKDTFKSVGAAFFGVQSEKNRKRDFSEGKLIHFILVGAFCVVLFIFTLVATVYLVLNNTV